MKTGRSTKKPPSQEQKSTPQQTGGSTHPSLSGSYGPEDVRRILGDPRKAVGLSVSNELAAARAIGRK
jgi:hypothetical protein